MDQQHFYILRKGVVVTQFQFGQLSQCEIKKASTAKRPGGLMAFGLLCYFPTLWFSYLWIKFFSQAKTDFLDVIATGSNWRPMAIQISVVGLCSFVGFLSIKQTLTKKTVLAIQTTDSKSYLFDLSSIENSGILNSFVAFSKNHLPQLSIKT